MVNRSMSSRCPTLKHEGEGIIKTGMGLAFYDTQLIKLFNLGVLSQKLATRLGSPYDPLGSWTCRAESYPSRNTRHQIQYPEQES